MVTAVGMVLIGCFSQPIHLVEKVPFISKEITVIIATVGFVLIAIGVGSFYRVGCYIGNDNAIGKPTTSIEIGQKYQVISTVIVSRKEGKNLMYLLLQRDNKIILYERKGDEIEIKAEDRIILTKDGEIVTVQKS